MRRVLAIDWSGAKAGAQRKIWLCEVVAGEVRRLENGRTREEIVEHLIAEAGRDPELVVGAAEAAEGSDDAFDALAAGLGMDRHHDELARLERAAGGQARLEGAIWRPARMHR